MSTTSSTFPDVAAIVARAGSSFTWVNVNGIKIAEENPSYAITNGTGAGYSTWVVGSDYGFSIPDDSTIDGIQVTILRKSFSATSIVDSSLRLGVSSVLKGDDKADTETNYPTFPTEVTYGDSTDTWGTTWSEADINNLEIYLSAASNSSHDAYIDYIKIEVWYTVTWDILDEDCSDISDWTDGDGAKSESKVDPAGQFYFNASVSTSAWRYRTLVTPPNTFTFEIKIYHDSLAALSSGAYFVLEYHQADEFFQAVFASDGLFLNDSDSNFTEVGTNLVKYGGSAEWQTWRFLVIFTGTAGDGTCNVYLTDSTHTNEQVGTSVPCSVEAGQVNQRCSLKLIRGAIINHIDYIKIATGLYDPSAPIFFIKSVDGVLIENVYNINKVLVENIKSINGITIQ